MRVLLVTNDFPPTIGGIQSYLRDFISTLPPQDVVVFASTQDAAAAADWDDQAAYRVYRWPRRVMLPTPATARRMQQIIRAENIDVVWFGAAAPLALMARPPALPAPAALSHPPTGMRWAGPCCPAPVKCCASSAATVT